MIDQAKPGDAVDVKVDTQNGSSQFHDRRRLSVNLSGTTVDPKRTDSDSQNGKNNLGQRKSTFTRIVICMVILFAIIFSAHYLLQEKKPIDIQRTHIVNVPIKIDEPQDTVQKSESTQSPVTQSSDLESTGTESTSVVSPPSESTQQKITKSESLDTQTPQTNVKAVSGTTESKQIPPSKDISANKTEPIESNESVAVKATPAEQAPEEKTSEVKASEEPKKVVSESSSQMSATNESQPTDTSSSLAADSILKLIDIKTINTEEGNALFIQTDGPITEHHHYFYPNPPRLVIDLYGKWEKPKTYQVEVDHDLIKLVRLWRYKTKLRVVCDLKSDQKIKPIVQTSTNGLNGIFVEFEKNAP